MKNKAILLTVYAFFALLFASCSNGAGTSHPKAEPLPLASSTAAAKIPHELDVPKPPAMVAGENEMYKYFATHYWDNFDFNDLTWIADTTTLEGHFYAWTQVLQRIPEQRAAELAGAFIGKAQAQPQMLLRLASVAEYHFGHPNSPFRNEELYIPVLKAVIAAPDLDMAYKLSPQAKLKTAMKNRPGTVAANFAYTTADGKTHRLHQAASSSAYTLLYFYDPDCEECRHTTQQIGTSEVIASRRLQVVAIYADEEVGLWRAHLPKMPTRWTVGYNPTQTINRHNLYDLRAIPCLYLLDKQKRVVLKDARINEVEHFMKE